jgi:hypothetical protein
VHNDGTGLRAKQFVHHLLVEHTSLAVEDHHLHLEAVRLHLRKEIIEQRGCQKKEEEC